MTVLFVRGRWALVLLLLLPLAARAQVSPSEAAQFWRRLGGPGPTHRYWKASPDSLRRVLAGQRADTARLQTIERLQYVASTTEAQDRDALATATRLHYPEQKLLRLIVDCDVIGAAKPFNQRAYLASSQAVVKQYDSLGVGAPPGVLYNIRYSYDALNEPEAKRTYFQQQLAYYQQHGPLYDVAACYRTLGGYYESRGDYNQAISSRLRAAELFREFDNSYYYNEIAVIGSNYAEWGNGARALPYLKQAAAWRDTTLDNGPFLNLTIARIYYQQGRYPLALRYVQLAQRPRTPHGKVSVYDQAMNLASQSAVLLALGRVAEVRPLLRRAQHLADSLRIPIFSSAGELELAATWARYYAATGDYPRAEAAWQTAYRQAQKAHQTSLRLSYLQALAHFYEQRGRPARAAPYALAALALADTLNTAQAATHIAQYELTQADRAQQTRLSGLRRQQAQATAQAQRQHRVLRYVSAGVGLLLVLAGVLYVAFRRSERLTRLVTAQKQGLQTQRDQLDQSLTELRATQAQLIQKEKMASLGELTAGIAHEIQNPLNFVNNFSEVSAELVAELKQELDGGDLAEAHALADDLAQNLGKITQHGQRASGIVRGMLEHSRQSTGERQPTDVNALADEYLRLAYHGLRAKDKTFNAELKTDFAPTLPLVEGVGADLGRVLLNLFNNAFYAVQQRQRAGEPGYAPRVTVSTKGVGQQVEICVTDNGTGMSPEVQAKIFQPFFTTKPTGEGTGLGLSLAHDIIAQGHGGILTVESQPGQGTMFTITLPA